MKSDTRLACGVTALAAMLAAGCSSNGSEHAAEGASIGTSTTTASGALPQSDPLPGDCAGLSASRCSITIARRGPNADLAKEVALLRERFALAERDAGSRVGPVAERAAPASRPVILSGVLQRLEPSAGGTGLLAVVPVPELERGPWRSTARPVRVEHPLSAAGATRVADASGLEVSFRLRGASAGAPRVADGLVVYPGAYRGGHVVHRPTFTGVEDYVVLEQAPPEEALHYDIDVSKVGGLRLVDGRVLELVDASGVPRLRMNEPYLVTEAGERVAARIAVRGCAYDDGASLPWGRVPTPAGSARCEVVVSWSGGTYPALFDPLWSSTGLTLAARSDGVAAFVLPGTNGNVMISGGGPTSSEIFNPASGTFSTLRDYAAPFAPMRTVPAGPSGWAVCFGGYYGSAQNGTQAYDPFAHNWQWSYGLFVPIDGYAAGVGLSGSTYNMLVVGGASNTAQTLTSAGAWQPVIASGASWPFRGSTLTEEGTSVLVAGGAGAATPLAPTSVAILWGATNLVAYPTGSMTTARYNHTATRLTDGTVLMVGGLTGATASTVTGTAERYLPALGGVFQLTSGALNLSRYAHVAAPLPNGRVLLAGGGGPAPGVGQSAEIYVEATQQFVRITDPPVPWGHSSLYPNLGPDFAAATIGDGSVLLVGRDTQAFRQDAIRFTLRGQGEACDATKAVECASGFCVDGVCCNSACTGSCQACSAALKESGASGTCGAAKAGTSDGACAAQPGQPCGSTGACNASGGCAVAPNTVSCGATTCAAGVQLDHKCDGNGSCQDIPTDCGSYVCGPSTCLTTCSSSSQCASGTYCNTTTGVCVAQAGSGTPCTSQAQCQAGTFCVDGFCCNTQCSSVCEACSAAKKGQGADGECGAVQNGLDPDNDCTTATPSTCGTTGLCDGARQCARYGSSTSCGQGSSCSAGNQQLYRCDGAGNCVSGSTTSCAPYACEGNQCGASCAVHTDCAADYYCDGGSCVLKLGSGESCSANAECALGFCVDGVCCSTACNGACEACSNAAKGQGPDGTCGLVVSGLDPHGSCPTGLPDDCGFDGTCDGLGNCARYVGNACGGGATCNGNNALGQLCNGQGSCEAQTGTGVPCGAYSCIQGQGCATSCSQDTDCASNAYFCNQNACHAKKADGQQCAASNECTSSQCVDGVCCENACTSKCQACSSAKKGAGEDGVCGAILAGTDPDEECDTDLPSTCGFNGSCNGNGGCALHAAGVACGETECNGNTVVGQACNGTGSCVFDPNGTACEPYACNALFGQCNQNCITSDECATGDFFCDTGQCVQKKTNGAACSQDAGCVSGHCVDGVCCDAACPGQCEACDVVGAEGTCSAIGASEAPHGTRDDCNAADPTCAGRCDGVQRSCVYPGSQTLCGDAQCNGNVLSAYRCDANGACVADQAKDCGAYGCNADAIDCNASCVTNAECASGAECDTTAGQCVFVDTTCADATTVEEPDGTLTSCAPYRCQAGLCLTSCDNQSACASGNACVGGRCEGALADAGTTSEAGAPPEATSDSGCGCRAAGGNAPTSGAALALLGFTLALSRRRRRVARRSAGRRS